MDSATIRTGLWVFGTVYALNTFDSWFGSKDDKKPPGGDVPPHEADPRPATLTALAADGLATAIEAAVWGTSSIFASPWERDAAVGAALMLCNVTADVAVLANAYGYRGTALDKIDLFATVATYLDADVRETVNADYQAKGILFRWA